MVLNSHIKFSTKVVIKTYGSHPGCASYICRGSQRKLVSFYNILSLIFSLYNIILLLFLRCHIPTFISKCNKVISQGSPEKQFPFSYKKYVDVEKFFSLHFVPWNPPNKQETLRAGDTRGVGGLCQPPLPTHTHTHTYTHTFLRGKNEKQKQMEKRKDFKAKTIKRLSPRSKFYCLSHFRASKTQKKILSANNVDRQYFSVFHGPSTMKSISEALTLEEDIKYE